MLGGIGVLSFGLLILLEIVTETDEVEFADVLVDAAGTALDGVSPPSVWRCSSIACRRSTKRSSI